MKKIYLLICQVLACYCLAAQDPEYPTPQSIPANLVSAEYFIDTDPGFGLGTPIPITPAANLNNIPVTINTTGLSVGTHRLYIRTKNATGTWGLSNVVEFLYDADPAYPASPAAPGNIVQAEYFIDADPGIGNATPIPISTGTDISNLASTINTTGLSNGTHRLYLRKMNAGGSWSITSIKEFLMDTDPAYPTPPSTPGQIVNAEYFIDTDPGFGNGTPVNISAGTDISNIPIQPSLVGLNNGTHRIYLRSMDAGGTWSITHVQDFLYDTDPSYPVAPATPGNIVRAEYFINTDPGFGNGTPITITPGTDISNLSFEVNTTGLPNGNHTLFVRALDDWSLTAFTSFTMGSALPLRWVSFVAYNRSTSIDLQWKTTAEENTAHFEVERSIDGVHFNTIGKVSAVNSAGNHQYQFTDADPLPAVNHYRLKQVDLDGRFEHSRIVSINRSSITIRIYPNPVIDQVTILLKESSSGTIHIHAATGNLLQRMVIQVGATSATANFANYPAGVYFITVDTGTQKIIKKLIKR